MGKLTLASSETKQITQWVTRVSAGLSFVAMAGGLLTIAIACNLILRSYARIPFSDMWALVSFWAAPSQSTIHWLWTQHNEHRVALPKLVVLLDYNLFHGRDIFALALSFTVQLSFLLCLMWVFRKIAGLRGNALRTATAMAAICLFCTAQWENFVCGLQITFILVGFLFFLANVAVVLLHSEQSYTRNKNWAYITGVILAGTGASYTAANGILVWPVVVLGSILHRCRKRVIALLAVCGMLVTTSYLYHYHSPRPHSNVFQGLERPFQFIEYVIKYLGSPWNWGIPALAIVFGLIGLTASIIALWRILFCSKREPEFLVLASLLLFVLGSAAMTALGRVNLGTDQALASRYETFAVLLWMALGVLAVRLVCKREIALIPIQVLLLTIMAIGAHRIKGPLNQAEGRKLEANTASFALLTGVYDQEALGRIYPNPLVPWNGADYLRSRHLSVFSIRLATDLNQPLGNAYSIRLKPCWGAVQDVRPIRSPLGSGFRVSGWVWDPVTKHELDPIVFASDGKIVGYAEAGYARPDLINRLGLQGFRWAGWIGYIEALPATETISIYARLNSRTLCPVAHGKVDADTEVPIRFLLAGRE